MCYNFYKLSYYTRIVQILYLMQWNPTLNGHLQPLYRGGLRCNNCMYINCSFGTPDIYIVVGLSSEVLGGGYKYVHMYAIVRGVPLYYVAYAWTKNAQLQILLLVLYLLLLDTH